MTCYLNFASSTPAPCLWPLPDVNIFLLFELRDLLKEQTPGMLCSIVTKLWHFQLDIANMKRTCLSFSFAGAARTFELGCWMLHSWVCKKNTSFLVHSLLYLPLKNPTTKHKPKKGWGKKRKRQTISKVLCPLHTYLAFILCIYFRKELIALKAISYPSSKQLQITFLSIVCVGGRNTCFNKDSGG